MLVGAPKANTSQPGVLQGGAVYVCPWGTSPTQCTTIQFDSKGRLGELREGPSVAGGGAAAWGPGAPAARVQPQHQDFIAPSSSPLAPSSGLPMALAPSSQPSPRREGMIQKHVALISTESPTALGGQDRQRQRRLESPDPKLSDSAHWAQRDPPLPQGARQMD